MNTRTNIIIITYRLDADARKAVWVKTGELPDALQSVSVNTGSLTTEQRKALSTLGVWPSSFGNRLILALLCANKHGEVVTEELLFDRILSAEEIWFHVSVMADVMPLVKERADEIRATNDTALVYLKDIAEHINVRLPDRCEPKSAAELIKSKFLLVTRR